MANRLAMVLGWVLWSGSALAGEADVLKAKASCNSRSICRFTVTVKHADAGWKHYADAWEVLAPDGAVLATRILRHPHVDEQPFTRELADVVIPEKIQVVTVRARDSVHGHGGETVEVQLVRP